MRSAKKFSRYLKWFLLIGILQFASIAKSKTYYVKSQGDDAQNGLSSITAWKSISKVNASTFSAGDSVLFEAGATFTGNIYVAPTSYGTRLKPLVFGSFGIGKATIAAGTGHGFLAYNNAGIVVKNLIFEGSGYSTNTGVGVFFYMDISNNTKLDYIVIESVDTYGFKAAGIQLMAWPADESRSGYSNITISNSLAHHNGLSGISVSGYYKLSDTLFSHQKLNVTRCKAYYNDGISGWDTHSGNGIIIGQVDSCIIERCEAFENGKNNDNTKGGPAGIWAWDSKHVIIQYCYSHHNRTQTIDGDGFDLDGGVQNSIMQYNYSHDNDGPGFLIAQFAGARNMKNLTVRYNISERDGRGLGALIWSGDPAGKITAERIDFYNNTIFVDSIQNSYANAAFAVFANFGAMKDVRVCNNIFMTDNDINTVDIQRISNLKICNNVYFDKKNTYRFKDNGTVYTKLFAWQSATGQEMLKGNYYGFVLDPNLINPGYGGALNDVDSLQGLGAYRLNMNSKIIGKGLYLDSLLNIKSLKTDFYGDTINFKKQYTPGAHEILKPVANFSFIAKCFGSETNFKNLSTHGQVLRWNFGDGSISKLTNPDYRFKSPGTYNVTLVVIGKFGYIDSVTKNVQVFALPKANFSFNNTCVSDSVRFKNNSLNSNKFSWQFTLGDSSYIKEPTVLFKLGGKYSIRLIAGWSTACYDTLTKEIEVYNLPRVNFKMKNACVNTSLDLVNLSDSGGLYVWNFGDGNFSADYLPEHRFVQAGDFDIKLKVISDQNCSDSVIKSLSVYANSQALFETKDVCQNQAMEVKNTSVNASGFEWNFGDGSFSIAQSPKHIYTNPGNYAIRLNTISSDGCKDSTVTNVLIFALPDSVFTIIQKLNTLILKAKDTALVSYLWDFGNGAMPGNGFKVNKTYFDTGDFKVKLTVSNQNGCLSSSTQTVHIELNQNSTPNQWQKRNFTVSPNPSFGKVEICFDLAISTFSKLRVYDCSGKEVLFKDFGFLLGGNHCLNLDLGSQLISGIYRLVLEVGNLSYSTKLIRL